MKFRRNSPDDDQFIELDDLDKNIDIGRYERAAEILEAAQSKQQTAGNHLISEFLGVARQICLACYQSHAERDWHRRAEEMAECREERLKNQLHSLLGLIADGDPQSSNSDHDDDYQAPHIRSASTHSIGSGLLKLIQSLISHRNLVETRPPQAISFSDINPLARPTVQADCPPKIIERNVDLSVNCLGRFQVCLHGKSICNWQSLKAKSIFKYLIAHHNSEVSKEFLMDLFWPETDPDNARRNLHQAIYSLRQTLKQNKSRLQPIQFNDNCYSINPDLHFLIDIEEFEMFAETGIQLEASGLRSEAIKNYTFANDLYQGEFLEDEIYEDWTNLPREKYRNLYLDITDRLSEFMLVDGDLTSAIEFCQKILARDNCHENAHCRLMKCFEKLGQRNHVLRQYQLCVQFLKRDLDIDPSEETRNLFDQIMNNNTRARMFHGG